MVIYLSLGKYKFFYFHNPEYLKSHFLNSQLKHIVDTSTVILLPAHPASFAHKFLFQRVPGCNSMA